MDIPIQSKTGADKEMIEEVVRELLGNYLSDNKVDEGYVNREQLDYLVNNKIDARNIVNYTFAGTTAETFEHNLGRIPVGRIILNQTQDARIYGDATSWTSKRVTLRSTVANNKVRFLFL